MKDKNILLILAILLAFFAAWRIFSYRASHGEQNPAVVKNVQQAVATKTKELFQEPILPTLQDSTSSSSSNQFAAQENTPATDVATLSGKQPTASSKSSSAMPGTGSNSNFSSATPNQYGKNPYLATKAKDASASDFQSTMYTPSAADELAQKRSDNLSPYPWFNKEAKQKLDNDFNNLNTVISRAVQAALMPKSKKNANIEKYLHKTAAAPASEDPFQNMLTQMAAQKNEIVNSVSDAFGKQAGQRAGQLMDNFQRDLTSEVSKIGQDPQTTAQNVQKIAQTYQQKFDQMNAKNQYDKYVKDLTTQYNQQLNSLKQLYPDQDKLNSDFNRIFNQALQKDIALASKKMNPEEYMKERYNVQYTMQKEIEDSIRNAGVSAAKYHDVLEKDRKETIEQLEKEGKIVSVPRRESEEKINALSETLLKEQTDLLTQLEKIYGVQARAEFQQIVDDYYQNMMRIMNEEMTDKERFDEQRRLRIESNRQILELQREKIQNMENLPDEQKERSLQNIDKEIQALPKI